MHFFSSFKSTLLSVGLAAIGLNAHATVISFDDLSTASAGSPIQSPYGGLNWVNWSVDNGCDNAMGGGYCAGTVSGHNVASNTAGSPASFSSIAKFTFNSLDLTAAWNDGLQVTFLGLSGERVLFSKAVSPLADGPTHVMFNWAGIDGVWMFTSGGTSHLAYGAMSKGPEAAVDNITINASAVPEPERWALMLAGIGTLNFTSRLRRWRFKA